MAEFWWGRCVVVSVCRSGCRNVNQMVDERQDSGASFSDSLTPRVAPWVIWGATRRVFGGVRVRPHGKAVSTYLGLREVLHVHDHLPAVRGEAGHLGRGVAFHDDLGPGRVQPDRRWGPQLGRMARGLGRVAGLVVRARGGREHDALGDASGHLQEVKTKTAACARVSMRSPRGVQGAHGVTWKRRRASQIFGTVQ